jgi:hypothetical protein
MEVQMTNILCVESELFARYSISPDGIYTVVSGPDIPIRLHKQEGILQLRQFLPEEITAEAVAFNYLNGATTECALITKDGNSVTVIDLVGKRVGAPFPVEHASTVEYGTPGTIFVGTTDGEIAMLTVDEFGDLSLKKALGVSEYGIVLMAPSPLEEGAIVFYTDDGKLVSMNLLTELGIVMEREDSWEIEGMKCHPTLPIFAIWRSNGDISISSPMGWLALNVTPYSGDPQSMLKSVTVLDFYRFLAVSSREVVEIKITFPGQNPLEADEFANELDEEPSGELVKFSNDPDELQEFPEDQAVPTIDDTIIYRVQFGQKIVGIAATARNERDTDLTVLTIYG